MVDIQQQQGTWYPAVSHLFNTDWMKDLGRQLGQDIDKLQPPLNKIFRAFTLTPVEKVKVVIIGQDPYPGGQADGLAFSCGNDNIPYSLQVIFDSLEKTYKVRRTKLSLDDWAEQGVLLLNTCLTTRKGGIKAHAGLNWDRFVTVALKALQQHTIFMCWGNDAKNFMKYVQTPKGG